MLKLKTLAMYEIISIKIKKGKIIIGAPPGAVRLTRFHFHV
jgi:hypothetical protein